MKRKSAFMACALLFALTFSACDTEEKTTFIPIGGGEHHFAGDLSAYAADGVSFLMAYVPGGMTFPTGQDDEGTATVAGASWIGETEVTYELWKKVYDWATSGSGATGAGWYFFANPGIQGGASEIGPIRTIQHPVTTVNWRDSMVWCNALTEWYNAQKGTSYECVYTLDSGYVTPIRDSSDGEYGSSVNSTAGSFDNPFVNPEAKGFRLLSSNEWESAARYRDGTLWTYGDHVSGDDTGYCYNDGSPLGAMPESGVFGDYAVYETSSTAAVKSKRANALGLYDMSGNVHEWCFDWHTEEVGILRVMRGGNWDNLTDSLRVGYVDYYYPYDESSRLGLRIARSAD